MSKRIFAVIIALCLVALVGFSGFSVWHSVSSRPAFSSGGYVISEENMAVERISFLAEEDYQITSGSVKFLDADGQDKVVPQESFLHLNNGAVTSFASGVLLDFRDLSENFINHYEISPGLEIRSEGDGYVADTTSGPVTFGDHVWKISDRRYLVQSPSLTVHFGENDVREAEGYVLVSVSEDGVAQLITSENTWMTLSDDCYIQTATGVKVYPMGQLVDNGTYKMSLAKLSVDVDDNIVLTEAETRRQIVPELKIETEDGVDGADGNQGAAGAEGAAGEAGSDGSSGEAGEDGLGGAGGAAGIAGAGGEGGLQGVGGEGGANGKDGQTGNAGGEGNKGSTGDVGYTGATGDTGSSALVDSSTNSALPRMTFTDWQVTTNSLRGKIQIVDEGHFLSSFVDRSDYPATVTIENIATGEKIYCHEVTVGQSGETVAPDTDFNSIKMGSEEAVFTTVDNPLTPDTAYRISVVAYYKVNEAVFSREFLSRTFYTDSAGIHLIPKGSEETSVGLQVNAAEDITKATVYLLTDAQNDKFTLVSGSNSGAGGEKNYQYKCELDYANNRAILTDAQGAVVETINSITRQQNLRFTQLPSNTRYIARVSVERSGATTLTNQQLSLLTLKKIPTWDGVPKVNYNRVTGGFEVYRPVITDTDGSAVQYTYTAYDSTGKNVMERALTATESEPAVFYLNSGETYSFGVVMECFDNEKTVYYDLGKSEAIQALGTALPRILLQEVSKNYNSMTGTLRLTLNEGNTLEVNPNQPLELNIYADQIYDQNIVIVGTEEVKKEIDGNLLYSAHYTTPVANEATVALELNNLYRNTNYIITVTGNIDLGDGNGAQRRTLGSVSFSTTNTDTLVVTMADENSNTHAISMRMRIAPQEGTSETQEEYDLNQLKRGRVALQLYTGTGFSANLLAVANLDSENDLNEVYGGGYLVTEEIFGNPSLDPDASYTLKVASVADQTFDMGLSYVNYFEPLVNPSVNIVADATPPDLLRAPETGVTATPIYNVDAPTYNAQEDPTLPEDAIIGYLLQAKFDNSQRLGIDLTYYAMEYLDFYNAVSAKANPLDSENVLMETTISIKDATDMPKVAYLFGGEKSTQGQFVNGTYVYYTGNANVQGEALTSGMGRGFRYAFGYRVIYSTSGSTESSQTAVYPDDHKDFENYKAAYGVGTENGKTIGAGYAYVLNSGMCEAPKVTPLIQSYLYSTSNEVYDKTGNVGTGNLEIHFTYSNDPDQTINPDVTTVRYNTSQGEVAIKLNEIPAVLGDDSAKWKSVKNIPYSTVKGQDALVDVIMDIEQYVLNYDTILKSLYEGTASGGQSVDTFYLCRIPVEWTWGAYLGDSAIQTDAENGVRIKMYSENISENRIDFGLTGDDTVMKDLASRALTLRLDIETVSHVGEEPLTKTLYLPIQINEVQNTYTASLSTGLLGMEFLNKAFTVSATVFYDTGSQGWAYAEEIQNEPYRALQFTGNAESPVMGEYVVVNTSNSYINLSGNPKNGLATLRSDQNTLVNIRSLAGKQEEDTNKTVSFTASHQYLTGKVNTFTYHLYPTQQGVAASGNADRIAENIMTLKRVGSYPLSFEGGNEVTLNQITPTIQHQGHDTATTEIEVRAFSVEGFDQAEQENGSYKVYAALYNNEINASNLTEPMQELALPLNAEGKYAGGAKFTNLASDTTHYITYYMKVNGSKLILLNAATTEKAVYAVTTTKNVNIQAEYSYENDTYLSKNLIVEMKVSRNYNLSLRYDFFAEEDAANKEDGTPLLSYEQMKANNMLTEPAGSYNDAKLTVNLAPSANRQDLQPGRTYYLRIQALEGTAEDVKVVGQHVLEIPLPPIGNYGALIYAANATSNSLEFQVTINDSQRSFMGTETADQNSGLGLYAVRFVYREGNREVRLDTTYDSQLYTIQELRRSFILSENVLNHGSLTNQKLKPGIDYYMQVYAVVDTLHNGQSFPINSAGDRKDQSYFFADGGAAFHNLINAVWGNDREYNSAEELEQRNIAANFLVAEKLQTTTNDSGVLLNEGKAVLARSGTNQFQVLLPESFGLIGSDGTQAFKRIEWNVTGSNKADEAINVNGTSLVSKNDKLIQQTNSSSIYRYFYDIPESISAGNYVVVLQLYETEDAPAPAHTLSFTFYDS